MSRRSRVRSLPCPSTEAVVADTGRVGGVAAMSDLLRQRERGHEMTGLGNENANKGGVVTR